MDGIRPATDPRRTSALLTQVAQDAGQVPEGHYRALGATFQQKQADFGVDQHRTPLQALGKTAGLLVAKYIGKTVTEKLEAATEVAAATASRFAAPLRFASAGNAILGTLSIAYELMEEGFVRPNLQGDALSSTANNDAMMVGLAEALDAPQAFKAAMARMRPEVATQGGAAILAQFLGKDREMLPVLQYRADDGLVQARPWAESIAAARTPKEQELLLENFAKSDVGQHAGDDSAFGLGIAEALWAVGARDRGELTPSAYADLFDQAHARLDALRPPLTVR